MACWHKVGTDGIRYLAVAVQRCVRLTYLNLSGIKMTAKMLTPLSHAIGKSRLQTLIMHHTGLKNTSNLDLLISGCTACMSLTNLSLKTNDISAASGEASNALQSPSVSAMGGDIHRRCALEAGHRLATPGRGATATATVVRPVMMHALTKPRNVSKI